MVYASLGDRAEYERAVNIMQRVVRARRARRMWAAVVDRARAFFLNPQAIAAGAKSGKYYSDVALVVREGLRSDPKVVAALEEAWRCVRAAARNTPHGEHLSGTTWLDLPIADCCGGAHVARRSLGPAQYRTMLRKMYLVVKEMSGDVDIDPIDCLESIQDDWSRDAGASAGGEEGAAGVSQEGFHRAWFECCDLHLTSVQSGDYVDWLRRCTRRITRYTGKGADLADGGSLDLSKVEWRTERALLDALGRSITIREVDLRRYGPMPHADIRRQLFAEVRTRWEDAFGHSEEYASRCRPGARSPLRKLGSNRLALWHARPTVASLLDTPTRPGARPRHRSPPMLVARAPSRAQAIRAGIAPSGGAAHRTPPSLQSSDWLLVLNTAGHVVGARRADGGGEPAAEPQQHQGSALGRGIRAAVATAGVAADDADDADDADADYQRHGGSGGFDTLAEQKPPPSPEERSRVHHDRVRLEAAAATLPGGASATTARARKASFVAAPHWAARHGRPLADDAAAPVGLHIRSMTPQRATQHRHVQRSRPLYQHRSPLSKHAWTTSMRSRSLPGLTTAERKSSWW